MLSSKNGNITTQKIIIMIFSSKNVLIFRIANHKDPIEIAKVQLK